MGSLKFHCIQMIRDSMGNSMSYLMVHTEDGSVNTGRTKEM